MHDLREKGVVFCDLLFEGACMIFNGVDLGSSSRTATLLQQHSTPSILSA